MRSTTSSNGRSKPAPSESVIVKSVATGLRRRFGKQTPIAFEVKSHGRCRTDIIALVADEVVSVEVKRSDWRRAITQATLNRYCADRSYVALWGDTVRDGLLQEAEAMGLGVIFLANHVMRVVQEAPSATPHPLLRERLLGQLDRKGSRT